MERAHVLSLALVEEQPGAGAAAVVADTPTSSSSSSLVYRRVRRQVVARGLARKYGDVRAKESAYHHKPTRYQRQIAIVEEFRRQRVQQDEASAQQHGSARRSDDAASPGKGVVVAAHSNGLFPKKTSLRQLPPAQPASPSKNQHEDMGTGKQSGGRGVSSPNAQDIEAYAKLASTVGAFSPRGGDGPSASAVSTAREQLTSSGARKEKQPVSRAVLDKSTAQVLCELQITKDIMMREHTVEQIHEVVHTLHGLASELLVVTQRTAGFDAAMNASTSSAPLSSKRISAATSATSGASSSTLARLSDSAVAVRDRTSAARDAAQRERERQECHAKHDELAQSARHRVAQLQRLIASLQNVTIDIVASVREWRRLKAQRNTLSNFETLHRFAWKKRRIANYIIHLDEDLRDLFPSAVMDVCLRAKAVYNPLLLPRNALDMLGMAGDAFESTTFLTERRADSETRVADTVPPASSGERELSTAARSALAAVVKSMGLSPKKALPLPAELDAERTRQCLEAIRDEHALERAAAQRHADEAERIAMAYNPFETIKVTGGVEETLTHVLDRLSGPEVAAMAAQLRHRQEDTHRVTHQLMVGVGGSAEEAGAAQEHQPMLVNPSRLRRLVEQRREMREPSTECELKEVAGWGKKNRLRGHVMVRKVNTRLLEHQHARKIQQQFLAHRHRVQLLTNLARFVALTRRRVILLQKVMRGFLAKRKYQKAKQRQDEQRRRTAAAKQIVHTYRRFKRRLRHRQSMSVEAVAQIQLFNVIQQHAEDDDGRSVERYRRVGEERRRQRAVIEQRRKQELLELEIQRVAAAVRIQSVVRMHAARAVATTLRGERKAHLSAVSVIMIQSTIRKFLRHQEARRQRFRSDLERVNRSAVRIQSIYRGYNSRASLLLQMDERMHSAIAQTPLYRLGFDERSDTEDDDDDDDEHYEANVRTSMVERSPPRAPAKQSSFTLLPPISAPSSRPSTAERRADANATHEGMRLMMAMVAPRELSPPKVALPPIRPRALSVAVTGSATPSPATRKRPSFTRQLSGGSSGMTKVELKLKEPVIGDDLDTASGVNTAAAGPVGLLRRRDSSSSSSSNGSSRTLTTTKQ